MLDKLYPIVTALVALVTSQAAKPLLYYLRSGKWNFHKLYESGGSPSSHTATFVALALAIGFQEGFDTSIFALATLFALVISYDAANVRYYAGQNIQVTQQLIKDIRELKSISLTDPIYETKIKEVLGHKWAEVAFGFIWGIMIALILSNWR